MGKPKRRNKISKRQQARMAEQQRAYSEMVYKESMKSLVRSLVIVMCVIALMILATSEEFMGNLYGIIAVVTLTLISVVLFVWQIVARVKNKNRRY